MPGAMDIMKAPKDERDLRVRLEAFRSVGEFTVAITTFYDEVAEESWYSGSAHKVVEKARSACVYLADDIRSPIDRALGILDARDDLTEHFATRFSDPHVVDELHVMVATLIMRELIGMPTKRVWPNCSKCGKADKTVSQSSYHINAAPHCSVCWYEDYQRKQREAQADTKDISF